MAQLTAPGKTEAASADIVLLATDTVMLNLCPADTAIAAIPENCCAIVQVKTSAGGYVQVAILNSLNPVHLVQGPGTYRVLRKASEYSIGIDKT